MTQTATSTSPAGKRPRLFEFSAVKEAQRVMPVVPVTLPRRAVAPVTVGETAVPAGARQARKEPAGPSKAPARPR